MNIDKKGLIGTLVFHVLLLLYLLISAFVTPLPLPGEEGILINFGDTDLGSGPEEPREEERRQEETRQANPEAAAAQQAEEAFLTQDDEEAPALPAADKPTEKKETVKNTNNTKTPENPAPKEEKKEEKPRINTQAMYQGRKTDATYSGSEGTTTGTGNQGDPQGSTETLNHSLGGGAGITPNLTGRSAISLVEPSKDFQTEGKIVVEITVDRSGKVINAVPGVKGSTTFDRHLMAIAREAALATRFDNKPDAPWQQKGTIAYVFRLK